jgi:sigma-B regulation protein RsbU (phosphoserine phosphatase)
MDQAAFRMTTQTKPRVLVADDQVDVQEALRLLLKGAGYDADTVGSPRALLSAVRERTYDLVLLDMNYTRDTTSGEEGLDLLARLREMNHTPVIVMTAWSDVELAVEAMRRGASDFVQKPWDNARLLRTVSKYAQAADKTHARLQTDMEVARRIQQKLFPPDEGSIGTLEYAARCIPALNVGGDYYDVLRLDGDHTAFLLADVSGKGTAAALLMANLQGCIRTQAATALNSPAALLKSVNRLFVEASGPEHYVTLFFGMFKHSSRELT